MLVSRLATLVNRIIFVQGRNVQSRNLKLFAKAKQIIWIGA